ncbi:MAG TPA: hypothetical protein VM186_04460 [Planctomycetota bacterium]|nr:hypothetical protein [Planctomycetota bacterium]
MAKGKSTAKAASWSKEEIRELKKIYRNCSNANVAKELGRSEGSVSAKARALGLTKSKKYLKSIGRG